MFGKSLQSFKKLSSPSKKFQLNQRFSFTQRRANNFQVESAKFDLNAPIDNAWTPPGSWYTQPTFLDYEKQKIFKRNWLFGGFNRDLKNPGDYLSNTFMGEPYILARGEDGKLRGFYNICRHHAAPVTPEGTSNTNQFVCCYHGWTYALDGKLVKATKLKGIKDFSPKNFGLIEFEVEEVGPFVFLRFEKVENQPSASQILQPFIDNLIDFGYDPSMSDGLTHHGRRVYTLNCNWKIVNDNYLDGEYHIPYVHPGLSSALDMSSYKVQLSPKLSQQLARPGPKKVSSEVNLGEDFSERFASGPVYGFMYPNFAVNRVGALLETNQVIPISHDKTQIVFEYFFDNSRVNDADFVEKNLQASDKVQVEDTAICELIFKGMSSDGYRIGRYAPSVESATHHFHQCLAADLQA